MLLQNNKQLFSLLVLITVEIILFWLAVGEEDFFWGGKENTHYTLKK